MQIVVATFCVVMLGCDVQTSEKSAAQWDTCLVYNAVLHGGTENFFAISNLCDQIEGCDDGRGRYQYFRKLIDETMSVDLATIYSGDSDKEECDDEMRKLGLAYSNVRMIVEEVHARLFVSDAPPIEQLYPWLMLIKKMNSEDLRTHSETSHSRAYIKVVEHRFERCLREGKFRSRDEIDLVRRLYFEAVGRELSVRR